MESNPWGGKSLKVTLSDTLGKDRAVTLLYALPVAGPRLRWLDDPRRSTVIVPGREYCRTTQVHVGADGRLSQYPLGAVAADEKGTAIAIDCQFPAFYRIGYNSGTGELYLAYDIGLTPEKPSATLSFFTFRFDAAWGFRAVLERYYEMPPALSATSYASRGFGRRFPDQPGRRVAGLRLSLQGGRPGPPGTATTAFSLSGNRAHDLVDVHARRTCRGRRRRRWRKLGGSPRGAARKPRPFSAAATTMPRAASSPGCSIGPGVPGPSGACPAPEIRGEATDFKTKWNPAIQEQFYGPSNRRAELEAKSTCGHVCTSTRPQSDPEA